MRKEKKILLKRKDPYFCERTFLVCERETGKKGNPPPHPWDIHYQFSIEFYSQTAKKTRTDKG